MFDFDKRTLIGAFAAWLVPLVVSFVLYNPETGVYLPNIAGFKIIMAALAAIVTFFAYRWIAQQKPLTIGAPNTFLALNAVFDIILLVGAFGMAFSNWLLTILPIYVVVFYGLYVWLAGKRSAA